MDGGLQVAEQQIMLLIFFTKPFNMGKYESFLSENTGLPMMYMPDAIRATIELMEAPAKQVKIRSSYNLAGNKLYSKTNF